jgi:hypothetical protein
MKFMSMVYSSEKNGPPPAALMEAIAQLGMDAAKAGTMVQMGGLYQSAQGARVRLAGGKITVTDGPFTETKEIIGGFAVFQFNTKKEAIEQVTKFMELHRKHWPGWEGVSEVRQIYDQPGA